MLNKTRLIFALFVLLAVSIFGILVAVGYSAGHGNLLMPLDDVYIHFQYAKQMALGQPYVYNPGQEPTSGATSFLYPYILAFGYLIGFKGLWLGLWAMVIGLVALIAAQLAVYGLCTSFDCPQWLSILTKVVFTLTGSIAWHFMSGMETGLMIALTLWTLFMVINKRLRGFIIVGTLLALMRPEGGILVLIAVGTMFLRLWGDYGAHEKLAGKRRLLLLLLIPVLAIGVQPLVNLVVTGNMVATGNQAKSILATVPHDWNVIIGRIWDNFVRMWWEFVTGYDAREGRGWYLPLGVGIFGLSAIVLLMFQRGMRLIGWMLLGWLLALTAAISTLDTAFWHFKRYQMPMMALFFPLAAYFVARLLEKPLPKSLSINRERLQKSAYYVLYTYAFGVIPLFAIALLIQFVNYHRLNVGYVYQQPYQMALWLRENTPEDAVIAVHDVGMMRYMGERTTLDIVGLTTPGAAAYWRNGPGSVAEFLINEQPDYIASYGRGHGYGLAYLADTSLYGEPLASFPIENWNRQANVALAADFQGIYQPDLEHMGFGSSLTQIGTPYFVTLLSFVNVADLNSEGIAGYQWSNDGQVISFPSQVQELSTLSESPCPSDPLKYCSVTRLEAGRRINQSERFNLATTEHARLVIDAVPSSTLVLATLVQAVEAEQVDVYVNDTFVATRMIPAAPGRWYVILTQIPSEVVDNPLWIELIPHNTGTYMPYFHALYEYPVWDDRVSPELADYSNTFYLETIEPSGDIYLTNSEFYSSQLLVLNITWFANTYPQGDYRFFVHLYGDRNQPPIAQWDGYFAGIPVGNWLRGMISDTIKLNIEGVSSGTYSLAIGFYNPQTGGRLVPTSDRYEVSPDGRLWLGEVTIGDETNDTQD